MNLSPNEVERRRTEIKSSWGSHPVNRNCYGTDQLETSIICGCGGEKLRQAIEHYENTAPELSIGCDDLIKTAIAFGNLPAVVELWGYLDSSHRNRSAFNGDNWGLAIKYHHDHIVEYLINNHTIPEYSAVHALKDLAPWASLNTLKIVAQKYKHPPSMCASALLEACINPRDDVMIFLAHLSGLEALKKLQYGIANPQIAELFGDPENIEKVRVFNTFAQKLIVSEELKKQNLGCPIDKFVRKIQSHF